MMSDLISRQAAIDAHCELCEANDKCICVYCKDIERFMNLPTTEPRKGKWIDGNKGKWNSVYCPKCSVCGTPFYGIETARYHYCPNCGAKMEE